MKAFHPDDTGMVLADGGDRKRDNKKGGGGGGGKAMPDPFLPGQKGALARQLNLGFGGGLKDWRQSINATYAPFRNAIMFPYGNLASGRKNDRDNQRDAPNDPIRHGGRLPPGDESRPSSFNLRSLIIRGM